MPTPSSRSPERHRGSALAVFNWTLAWLAGTAAITGFSVTRHAPALERLMLDEVQEAIAPLGDGPIMVSLRDHEATLSGRVSDARSRDAMLAAADDSLGIRTVVDRLVVGGEPEGEAAPAAVPSPEDLPDDEPSEETTLAAAPSTSAKGDDPTGPDASPEEARAAAADTDDPSDDEASPADRVTGVAAAGEEVRDASPSAEPAEAIDGTGAGADAASGASVEEAADASPDGAEPAPDTLVADESTPSDLPPEETDAIERSLDEDDLLAELPPEILPGTEDEGDGDREAPSAEPAPIELSPPTLRLEVADGVLTLEGTLSDEENTDALVDTASDVFDLDYVSDALESDADTGRADWLEPLVALLPALRALDDPSVGIDGREVLLRGTAPDASARDRVVEAALERLGDYSLIERIEVATPPADEPSDSVADGPATGDDGTPVDASDADGAPTDDGDETDTADVPTDATEADDAPADETGVNGTGDATDVPDDATEADDAPADETGVNGAGDATDVPDDEIEAGDAPADETGVNGTGDATDVPVDETGATDADVPVDETGATDADEPVDAIGTTDGAAPEAVATDEAGGDGAPGETDGTSAPPSAAALRSELAALPGGKILFESGSDTLTAASRTALDAIARVLARHPDVPIAIEGHTDGRGYRARNLRLSQQRANAVRDHLVSRGIPRERLTAYGYGEGVPVADNATPEGRAANRRIEFTY